MFYWGKNINSAYRGPPGSHLPSASDRRRRRAPRTAAPAPATADAKAAAKDAEPTTTKDPQIALDDLELMLAPMTKEETETEAKGWYSLLRAKEREITVAELDVRRKNREIAQLEKQKTAAADLAKATEEVKAATSDKDKEAAAQHLAEAQKNLAQTVKTASKETVKGGEEGRGDHRRYGQTSRRGPSAGRHRWMPPRSARDAKVAPAAASDKDVPAESGRNPRRRNRRALATPPRLRRWWRRVRKKPPPRTK